MNRYLSQAIKQLALDRHKMAFVAGPRQVGKTTLAQLLGKEFDELSYCNWDETEFRRLWTKSPNRVADSFKLEQINTSRLLIIDEIHKSKGWKQKLKGLYDHLHQDLQIIVTGSARLNVYKKGGDSLMGRYLNFRLHPFSYGELVSDVCQDPEIWKRQLFLAPNSEYPTQPLENLMKFSGFPEPYTAASEKILNIWRRGRTEKIIREDLRDLSRLPELSQVEMLASLIPTKIGSPLSIQSLREDLEVAHDTVSRWMRYLFELYYFFELKPWTKSISRSLKKEGKIYLYDWTELNSTGLRFENLIACHLKKACDYWTDTGEGTFDLHYARDKEKHEIDFIIVKNKKPWLAVEAKATDTNINWRNVEKLASQLKCPFIQVVLEPNIWSKTINGLVCSAHHLLHTLP